MSNDSEIRTTLNSQRKHEQMYSFLHHVAPDLAKAEGIPRSPEPPSTVLAKTKIPLRALAKPSSFPGIGFFLRYTMSAYQHTAKIHVLLFIYIYYNVYTQTTSQGLDTFELFLHCFRIWDSDCALPQSPSPIWQIQKR